MKEEKAICLDFISFDVKYKLSSGKSNNEYNEFLKLAKFEKFYLYRIDVSRESRE